MASKLTLSAIVPLPKSPELLVADAQRILEELGLPTPQRDATYGFKRDVAYIDDLMEKDRSHDWLALLARTQPAVLRFWYRESPVPLIPKGTGGLSVTPDDPSVTTPGMVLLETDSSGRLLRLEAVPPDFEETPTRNVETDWSRLFAAAGLNEAELEPAEPLWFPENFADERAAWEGRYPDAPEVPIRIEAASFLGRPISFRVVEPWNEPALPRAAVGPWLQPSEAISSVYARYLHTGLYFLLFVTLVLLAWRNLRLDRGDRRVAFRLGLVFFFLQLVRWLFGAHHIPNLQECEIFLGGLSVAFYYFGIAWLFYIAVEPYARRLWPGTMISWRRLFHGRFRDPSVGRDLLMGTVFGTLHTLVFYLQRLVPSWLGAVPSRPDLPLNPTKLFVLSGVDSSLSSLFAVAVNTMTTISWVITGLILLRFVFRSTKVVGTMLVALMILVWGSGFPEPSEVVIVSYALLWVFFFFRFGWIAVMVGLFWWNLNMSYPLGVDVASSYFHPTVLVAFVMLAIASYGFKVSLAGRPAFGDLLVEESKLAI